MLLVDDPPKSDGSYTELISIFQNPENFFVYFIQ